jgi:hypothetical protein
MNFFSNILIILLCTLIIQACAKPTVVDVKMLGDKDLNCKELKEEVNETKRFRKEAIAARDVGTGGNVTRTMLFWPALVKSMHNADIAERAAIDRAYHLIKIMKSKDCKDSEKLFDEITKQTTPVFVAAEIKRLNRLYKKGVINLEEFNLAKQKVLKQ